VIHSKQTTLLNHDRYENNEIGKRKLFIDAFLRDELIIEYKKNKYLNKGIQKINDSTYVGKFAKEKTKEIPKSKGKDIVDEITDICPYCRYICELENNIFIIERNKEVYKGINTLCNILSEMATKYSEKYGYFIEFKPITEKRAVWNVIENAEKIYYIKLKLNAPNLFGVNKSTREYLNEIKDDLNITTVEQTYSNKKGELNIKEHKEVIENPLEYIEEGGGDWELKTERGIVKSHEKTAKLIKVYTVFEDIVEYLVNYTVNKFGVKK
jgi:polyhydroxyalkanoate synthesis regulator phasin